MREESKTRGRILERRQGTEMRGREGTAIGEGEGGGQRQVKKGLNRVDGQGVCFAGGVKCVGGRTRWSR